MVPRDFKTKPIPCRDGTLVYPFSIPSREAQLKRLKNESFDVLVIGGGCVGAGGALPCICVCVCVCVGGGGGGGGSSIRSGLTDDD